MNKRETFYFTPHERELCQKLNIDRKRMKMMIHLMLIKEEQADNAFKRDWQEIIHAKWIKDDEE